MKKVLLLTAALVATVAMGLTGCTGPGEAVRIPLTMPDGERATIVAHKQKWPDWMLSVSGLALNYIVMGDVTAKQLAAVAETERACRIYTGTVTPSNLVTVVSDGVIYGTVGFLGIGAGSQALGAGVKFLDYGQYGAAATGLGGAANGIITLGSKTYTFENCGVEVLNDLFRGYKVRVLQKSPY